MASRMKPNPGIQLEPMDNAWPDLPPRQVQVRPKWSIKRPRTWGKWTYIVGGLSIAIIIIVLALFIPHGGHSSTYYPWAGLNYTVKDTYAGTSFFNNFDYINQSDPGQGRASFVNQSTAQSLNLTKASNASAQIFVDSTANGNDTSGHRYSVRVASKNQYNHGLFIFDIAQAPYGCSVWPTIRLADPSNWGLNGEIDIYQTNNVATRGNIMNIAVNQNTGSSCSLNVNRALNGEILSGNQCENGLQTDLGCGVGDVVYSAGRALHDAGGGVFAVEWRTEGIRMWAYQRNNINSDIQSVLVNNTIPKPSTWGIPKADFPSTSCNMDSNFRNLSIVIDIDLCGTGADAQLGDNSAYEVEWLCPGTCANYVANNHTAYESVFWEFNSIRAYTA